MTPVSEDKDAPRTGRREFARRLAGTGLASLLANNPKTSAADSIVPAAPRTDSSSRAVFPDSDVGTLFPFIQSQVTRGEFPLSFLQPSFRSVRNWRRKAQNKLLDLLHYSPPPCAPRPETLSRTDRGDHFLEHVEFNTTPDIRVPAYVLVPKNAPSKCPAIVALHDHGAFYLWGKEKLVEMPGENPALPEFRNQYYGGKAIAIELVRQGWIVVVIDMFYWGNRRMQLESDPDDWRDRSSTLTRDRIRAFNTRASQNEPLVGRSIYSAGFTWPGVMFWDDIRTVDYLVSRPDVDPGRIGCVGLSVGGLRSCHLAALDERIRASVVVGWMTSFPHQIRRHVRNTIGHTKVVPGLYRHLDFPDVAAIAMPRPMMVIHGSRDTLFAPEGVKASFDKLKACYRKAGVPDRCSTLVYDTPHEFNQEMQVEAWKWLKRFV